MRKAVLILFVNAVATRCFAQLPEAFKTPAGEYSGYYWQSMSVGEKAGYVMGFHAGYLYAIPSNEAAREGAKKSCLAQLTNPTPRQTQDCYGKSFEAKSEEYKQWDAQNPIFGGSYKDLIEATNRFFAEPENRVFPLTAAWTLYRWRSEGRPQAEIDNLIDQFRESFISAPRALCASGSGGISASRCQTLGTTLRPAVPK